MERNIRILKWIWGLIGFLPASAIWIVYFAKVGGSITMGATVFAVGMVIAAVFDIPAGVFSDRVGRKAAAIGANLAFLLCIVVYAAAQNWWQLLIAATFDGLGMAIISGNNSALLHESLAALDREDEFAVEYGRMMGWSHWSALAAAIAGSVIATFSLRWCVIAALPSFVVCFVVAFWLKEPERHIDHAQPLAGHVKGAVGVIVGSRRLSILALASMLSGGVGIALFQLRPSWIEHLWPIWAVGAARALSALCAAVGTWWGGRIVNRFGALRSSIVVQLVSSVVDISALLAGSVVSPAFLTTSSFAFGIGSIADGVLLQSEFTNEQRATLGSLVGVGTRIVYAFAAVGFGLLSGNGTLALILGEVLMIGSVGMYFRAFRPNAGVLAKKGEICIPST